MKYLRPVLILVTAAVVTVFTVAAAEDYTYEDDVKPILQTNGCIGCHSFMNTYDGLITKTSISSATQGLPIVNEAKPDSSVIVWRLEGETADGTSIEQMPQGGDPLPDATIRIVRDWIESGAVQSMTAVETRSWGELKSTFK